MPRYCRWLLCASVLAAGSAADAAIVIGTNVPGASAYTGPAPTFSFDDLAGTPSISGGAVASGSSLSHAQPLGSTGSYYSVGIDDGMVGTIDLSSFGEIFNLSLLWGSIDPYNGFDFLDSANNVLASFGGNSVRDPADGNQSDPNTNRLVTFLLTDADVTNFSRLRLRSNSNAFEIDNLAVNSGVPEPASWAMMMLGFAGLGLAMRRGRRPSLSRAL